MITRMDGGVAWEPLELAAEVTTADNFKWTDGGTLRMIALPVAAAASSTAGRRVLVVSEWAGQGALGERPQGGIRQTARRLALPSRYAIAASSSFGTPSADISGKAAAWPP